jgi:Tfp pilus assembly protein PilF
MPGLVSVEAPVAPEERRLRDVRGGRLRAAFVGGALCLALSAAGGCATSVSSSPFIVRQGRGPIEVGVPGETPTIDRAALARAESDARARRSAERPRALPSIEQRYPALRDALKALAQSPSADAHIKVAIAYHQLHVLDAAFDHFSDAAVFDAKSIAAWDGRARVWRDWGFVGRALADVHRARFLGPDRADVYNTLGTILERAGQCDGARRAYRDALVRDSQATWARENLTRLEAAGMNCQPVALKRSARAGG